MAGAVELYARGVELLPLPQVRAYAFSALPTVPRGSLAVVTDSDTNTWGDTVAGNGANVVLAWFNGAEWTVVGI